MTIDEIFAIIIVSIIGLYLFCHIIGWILVPSSSPFQMKEKAPPLRLPPPLPTPPPIKKKKLKPSDLDFLDEFPLL
jgi:hypothetical protein